MSWRCQFEHEVTKGGLKGSVHTNYKTMLFCHLLLVICSSADSFSFCTSVLRFLEFVALKALKMYTKKLVKLIISAMLDTTRGI